jgi:hypothetical protein
LYPKYFLLACISAIGPALFPLFVGLYLKRKREKKAYLENESIK